MILGVDPGLSGGFALYEPSTGRVEAYRMPTVGEKTHREVDAALLATLLGAYPAIRLAVVERVQAGPQDGRVQAFRFGHSYGAVRGVLGALQISTVLVTPGQWKPALKVPRDKDGARAVASRMFPGAAALWALKKDDGLAEAALIALYGARQENPGQEDVAELLG